MLSPLLSTSAANGEVLGFILSQAHLALCPFSHTVVARVSSKLTPINTVCLCAHVSVSVCIFVCAPVAVSLCVSSCVCVCVYVCVQE